MSSERTEVRAQGGFLSSARNYAITFIVGLLLGLIPMYLMARERGQQLANTQQRVRLYELQRRIANASFDAKRGEYELARQSAGDFYNDLRKEVDRNDHSALPSAEHENLKKLFANQNEIVTLLARNDPASVDRLNEAYLTYRNAVSTALPTDTFATQ